uniref:Uncharacterized protein n=1 Tax=Strix occidentalis caurina TaxID=311401 RepID=A0A8D0F0B2_STROC
MQTLVVLLAFAALFCCCSRTLARPMAMSILSRLEIQMAQPSEVQPNTPFRGIDTAAKFTGVAPADWPFRTGFGSLIIGYEYTCQEYAASEQRSDLSKLGKHKQRLSPQDK